MLCDRVIVVRRVRPISLCFVSRILVRPALVRQRPPDSRRLACRNGSACGTGCLAVSWTGDAALLMLMATYAPQSSIEGAVRGQSQAHRTSSGRVQGVRSLGPCRLVCSLGMERHRAGGRHVGRIHRPADLAGKALCKRCRCVIEIAVACRRGRRFLACVLRRAMPTGCAACLRASEAKKTHVSNWSGPILIPFQCSARDRRWVAEACGTPEQSNT